ncbi:MAG: branched-chain amino acid ABC transporter permease, partial [Anaerolineae bacterium]|nr:branched-chain amino acid ABC transporter permease [Anaerolineae bacterium]
MFREGRFLGQSWRFWVGAALVYLVFQVLFWLGDAEVPVIGAIFTSYIQDVIKYVCIVAMVSLGLNLIYGFNGQFSLGQWGFYAIGAYASADVTYRWYQNSDPSALIVLLVGEALVIVLFLGVQRWTRDLRLPDWQVLSLYLVALVAAFAAGVGVALAVSRPVAAFLSLLPASVAMQVIFLISVLQGGVLAAIVSFLFGLPVLKLGGDYFGIATLGFGMIVKVLFDNADAIFPEMKGARGMVGIPRLTTWLWAYLFLVLTLVVMRNLIYSSEGRAVISVRESEVAARVMGIDTAYYKTLSFVLGSLFAGVAGGLFAHYQAFLAPNMFHFIKSFDPLIIIVFGGLGSMTGTVAGTVFWAATLEGLRILLPTGTEAWRLVIYPVALLV